ncbi:MAG: molybdopterin-dependent oxidoreductase, partial [Gemmatimonadaceae bacterium]|jgi:DMSO/TMAO reductase YedYZ molybdopterin-dependent catalytic subunit|nr:molybdopterin-dependent oxidoreductase [Gemmatimonadaceae bacterium]
MAADPVRLADDLVHLALERLRARGALDRRGFLRLSSLALAAPLVAACDARGTDGTKRLLKAVGAQNEKLERALFRASSRDHGSPGKPVAGSDFPGYFVSDRVPTWDESARGPWRLQVDGAVQRPLALDLAALQRMARLRQQVNHYCVEGWTASAVFTGVPLAELARLAGVTPGAAYVDFRSFDEDYHESWDLDSAMHPQTMIVVAKEDRPLSPMYGAPARVHSPVKLGYKNTKYLTHVTFMRERNGGYWSDRGYEWYGGT